MELREAEGWEQDWVSTHSDSVAALGHLCQGQGTSSPCARGWNTSTAWVPVGQHHLPQWLCCLFSSCWPFHRQGWPDSFLTYRPMLPGPASQGQFLLWGFSWNQRCTSLWREGAQGQVHTPPHASSAQKQAAGLLGVTRHPCKCEAEEKHLVWGNDQTRDFGKISASCKSKLTSQWPRKVLPWCPCTPQTVCPRGKPVQGWHGSSLTRELVQFISLNVAVLQHLATDWGLPLHVHCPLLMRSKIIPSYSWLSLAWNLLLGFEFPLVCVVPLLRPLRCRAGVT